MGQVTVEAYPNDGPVFSVARDSMFRPVGLSRVRSWDNPGTVVESMVSTAQYNPAGQLTYATHQVGGTYGEERQYNQLGQLTLIYAPGVFTESYSYAAGANNGRINASTQVGIEDMTYQYDALNRLTSVTSNGSTLQTYSYDGFGNLTQMGGASWSVDGSTNRLSTPGITYDANGNQLKTANGLNVVYDVENRIKQHPSNGNQYAYDSSNRRVVDGTGNGLVYVFYSGSTVVGRYQAAQSGSTWSFTTVEVKAYFGRLIGEGVPSGGGWSWTRIATNRLSSVRSRGGVGLRYFPYGEERGGATGEERTKFATYWRESGTGLDYADQRQYAPSHGRFATRDPNPPPASVSPLSWNLFAYANQDPLNWNDPSGLASCRVGFFGVPDPANVCPDGYWYSATGRSDLWVPSNNGPGDVHPVLAWADAFLKNDELPYTQCERVFDGEEYGLYPGNPIAAFRPPYVEVRFEDMPGDLVAVVRGRPGRNGSDRMTWATLVVDSGPDSPL